MTPEEHSTLREMLGAFSLGDLSEAEATAVQAHLDGCADCRRDLAEIVPLAQSLTYVSAKRVSEVASPDPDLGRRIRAAVAVERAQHWRRARTRRSLLVAAAVLAIVAVGWAWRSATRCPRRRLHLPSRSRRWLSRRGWTE